MMTSMNRQKSHIARHRASVRTWNLRAASLAIVAACWATPGTAQSEEAPIADQKPAAEIVEPQLLTFRDPELSLPEPGRRLPSAYLELWIEALAGPEQELKRDVSISIGRAHQEGYLDCSAAKDALAAVLKDSSAPRSVLVEVARTLIALDAQEHSTALKDVLRKGAGTQFELVVEPALARWGDSELLTVWRQRLIAQDTPRHQQLLALQALAELPESATSDQRLHDELRNLITTSRDAAITLEAARTLGTVKLGELEPLAKELFTLTKPDSQLKQLTGVYLLLHHSSDASRELLLQEISEGLTEPRQAPIVRTAWRRLLELNVAQLASLAPQALRHTDPEVRRAGIDTLIRFPSKEGTKLLGAALDDRHPEIRRAARQGLLELSKIAEFQESVRKAGLAAIARSSWREQEQAAVLLALLDQSDAANRLLELLNSPHSEVAIAAAWGLRRLNVASTMDPLLKFAEAMDQQVNDGQPVQLHEAMVLAHVFEAMGRAKYQPAIPLLKRWIPKTPPRVIADVSRSAAIWSLGWLYEDSNDLALAQTLKDRVLDVISLDPESATVRHASAIALGRIGAAEVADDLKPIARMGMLVADLAAAWAINRLTGEVIPPPAAPVSTGNRWKLTPIGSRQKATSVTETAR